ncbi:MAG: hypothetical protein ACKO5C_08085 [Ferruginibacter sp.]
MIELILLFFMCRHNSRLAKERGLSSGKWMLITVVLFFIFESIGLGLAMTHKNMVPPKNYSEAEKVAQEIAKYPEINLFALFVGVGGFLLVRYFIERKPVLKKDEPSV